MTKIQIKILKAIYYNKNLTARDLCKKLGIPNDKADSLGGYYRPLLETINYISESEVSLDGLFDTIKIDQTMPDNDVFTLTSKGIAYIENYLQEQKKHFFLLCLIFSALVIFIIIFSIFM